jgi:hypothetical protein
MFLPGLALHLDPPTYATYVSLVAGLCTLLTFCPCWPSNCHSPTLYLPHSWNYRGVPSHLALYSHSTEVLSTSGTLISKSFAVSYTKQVLEYVCSLIG